MTNKRSDKVPLEATNTLILFSEEDPQPFITQYTEIFKVTHFTSFAAWKMQGALPSAFIIQGKDDQYISSILNKIRRHAKAFASLCFSVEPITSPSSSLVDGELPQPLQLQEAINRVIDLEESFKNSETNTTHQERLIKYLWLRPDFILQPVHEWKYPRFYRFPLLEALSYDRSDSFEWLQTLVNAKVLEPVTLHDRQRECAHCRSSHLSFVDICPNCKSIDIEMQASLHCFTCGCVDIQEKFIHSGMLSCPKCNTQLRHIGSDYDRPIENHSCGACDHTFVEGNVLARCAMCEKEMSPNDLVSNEIYSWRLSDRGRIVAIRGEFFNIAESLDQLDFISRDLFIHDLDWSLLLCQRYPYVHFSLLGIHFANLPELSELIGHTQLLQMIESFAQRLRGMLRTPDHATRTDENMLWIILPSTDVKGFHGFRARLDSSLKSIQQDSDHKLDIRFVGITSSQIEPDKENAELLLARLNGEIE